MSEDRKVSNPEESYKEVSRKTLMALDGKGWCLWRCKLFNEAIVCIVLDKSIFDRPSQFSDPLREARKYPFFTVHELRSLVKDSDQTIRMVYEVKKLAPANILFDDDLDTGEV
jgi:hypothetical protein